jgi:acid phosphatase
MRYDIYVRVNVNDGIVPLPGCDSGPGSSCPLKEFLKRVRKRGEETEEFGKICGLAEGVPERITFLHQLHTI